jgi:hypothetical protein
VDVEKLRGKEGELWLLVLVGEGSFHLRLLSCLVSREKSGGAGFCSVLVEMSSYLVIRAWLGQGRKFLMLQSHTPPQDCTFGNYLLALDNTEHYT